MRVASFRLAAAVLLAGGLCLIGSSLARSSFAQSLDATLTASDGASGDFFGTKVALSDDGSTALIGATNGGSLDEGSAYVFVDNGGWVEEAVLRASSSDFQDNFGFSVALSEDGSTAIVGSMSDDVGGNMSQGAAYIFTRSGSNWSEQARLTASDGAGFDQFGYSVALSDDGSTAIIGAEGDDIGAERDQGSAYVFSRAGGSWTEETRLTASDMADGDGFGYAVSLSDDGTVAVIGAPTDDVGGAGDQGSAYIFADDGGWSEQAKITASDGAEFDEFGWDVSLSGDGGTALVSSEADAVNNNTGQGSVYVFSGSGGSWSEDAKLTASDGSEGDSFGLRISLSNDGSAALIGAPDDDAVGAAYHFVRSGGSWSESSKLRLSSPGESDQFGFAVALSGETGLIGTPNDDVGGTSNQGSAAVFGSLAGGEAPSPGGPVEVAITETIGVSDDISTGGPVAIRLTETIGVADRVDTGGPVLVRVNETIGISDAVEPRLPAAVRPEESISIEDEVRVDVQTVSSGAAQPGDSDPVDMGQAGVTVAFSGHSSEVEVTAVRHSVRPKRRPAGFNFAGPGYWTLTAQGGGSFSADVCLSLADAPSGYDRATLQIAKRPSEDREWTDAETDLRPDAQNAEHICAVGVGSFSDFAIVQPAEANASPVFASDEVITAPAASITITGDPDETFTVSWNEATDPEGEALTYTWQLASSEAFETVIFEEHVGTATQFEARYGTVGTALTEHGIETETTADLYHRIVADDGGKQTASTPQMLTVTRGTLTSTGANDRVPEAFALYANYPDPFNPATTIQFDVPKTSHVRIRIFDSLGREVETLVDDTLPPGRHDVRFRAGRLASGVYLYRMEAGDFVKAGRMVLVK